MPDVFISYSREDRVRADQVAQGLKQLGLEPFWDTDIPPGQTWADFIEAKLSQCKAVVVLWSEHSTKSQWVREEARMGRDKSRLIPARLDASTPPFGFGEVQAADLSTWHGESNHPDWQRFSQAVFSAVRGADAPIPQVRQTQYQAPPQAPPRQQFREQPQLASDGSSSPVGLVQHALRNFVNGKGRARQSELGWFSLFYIIVLVVAYAADWSEGFDQSTGQLNSYTFQAIVFFLFICPFVSLLSRRLHDTGQNGWIAALGVVPFIGSILALVYIFIQGQVGENQYGPDPRGGV